MSETKKPLEQALDLFVFAPIGLLLNADEVIPNLIERGKQQVTMARMFGQFAVQTGQTEATKRAAKLGEQAAEVVGQLSGRASRSKPVATPRAPAKAAAAPVAPAQPATPSPAVATLAIPDYDSLSASQVVPRLEGLAAAELDAVRAYEAAHRGRKTILSKITTLQG